MSFFAQLKKAVAKRAVTNSFHIVEIIAGRVLSQDKPVRVELKVLGVIAAYPEEYAADLFAQDLVALLDNPQFIETQCGGRKLAFYAQAGQNPMHPESGVVWFAE